MHKDLWFRTKIIQMENPKAGKLRVTEKNASKRTVPHMLWAL